MEYYSDFTAKPGPDKKLVTVVILSTDQAVALGDVMFWLVMRMSDMVRVPGEGLSKVIYRMIDPAEHSGKNVLVVGGGDSALEAAHTIAEQPGTKVTLSYRSDAFSRAKAANRDKIEMFAAARKMNVMMSSSVREIHDDTVVIEQDGKTYVVPNDDIIVCAGGILPTGFLKNIGVEVETKFGTA